MNLRNRIMLCAFSSIFLAGTAVGQTPPRAQYPTQPIRLVVPWPAGGTTDVIARMLGQNLTADLGQSVVVENIGGAGGNIGTQKFVLAKPDGYTILMASSSTNAANPHLYKNLGFEPITDFTPIALVARVPSVLVVGVDSPLRSVRDIISSSKTKPEGLSYASAGVGSSAHLAGELLTKGTPAPRSSVQFYAALAREIKRVYNPEQEQIHRNSTFPIIPVERWDSAYMAKLYEIDPGYRDIFTTLFVDAYDAFKAHETGQKPTANQLAAVRATVELVGRDKNKIQQFLNNISEADLIWQEEQDKKKPGKQKSNMDLDRAMLASGASPLFASGVRFSDTRASLESLPRVADISSKPISQRGDLLLAV